MTRSTDGRERWDVFCRVVDNYGDIGIAWRLARQLALDGRREVRVIVDRVDVFARIEPTVANGRVSKGVAITAWSVCEREDGPVAAVVVELLGCGLPPRYLDAMVRTAASTPVVWIDFEHLSAEAWVPGFHGLPSPHAVLPLTKHFFYPGFGPRTGGLLVEPGIDERRVAFLASGEAVAAFWTRLGLAPPNADERRLALFAYPDAPVDALVRSLGAGWTALVPGGTTDATTRAIPFVDQDDFDRLLWLCDVNFVRGEDSFVRAQVAGKPFVWQIYRQADAVHLGKLAAFEALYEADLPTDAADAQRAMWAAWNDRHDDLPAAIDGWLAALPALRDHAERWRADLVAAPPLVDRLLAFVDGLRPSGLVN